MRAAFLAFLLVGCATKVPCPPLPALGADKDPIVYASTLATLYERCAAGPR